MRSVFEKAYAEGDFETVASDMHEDAIYAPSGRPPIQGRDSVVVHLQKTRPPGVTIELAPIETRVLSSEWVYVMGTSTIRFTPEGADTSQSAQSTYLAIFRKTADGWKLYREASGSDGN